MLGLPIRMIPCNNKNEVIHNWIQTGTLSSIEAQQSLAVAMDIQVCKSHSYLLFFGLCTFFVYKGPLQC